MNETNETGNKALWSKALDIIRDNVSEANFNTWFQPIIPVSWEEKRHILKLQIPSMFFQEFIEEHYADLLKNTLVRVYGNDVHLKFLAVMVQKSGSRNGAPVTMITDKGDAYAKPQNSNEALPTFDPFIIHKSTVDSHLNANYTMTNFVEGPCNKLAKSAGEAIAKNPGNNPFNPLFIHGASGMGKTHLENAIGQKILELHPDKNVVYVDALKFQTQYMDAVKNNNQTDFLNFYQALDVLVIDDIQEFMGKTGTQNTFFHIFNSLHQAKKQLVLACDRSPKLLQGMDQRMLSRFKWGLTVELEAPDLATRIAILKNKVEKDELNISDDIIEYIAENVQGTVRDIEGVVNSLLAHSTLTDATIDMELARQVVGQSIETEEKNISIGDIQQAVCEYYNLEIEDIQTQSRKREVVQARQVAMYLARKYTKNSLASIGAQIGNRNHATVLHACKTVEDLIDIDKNIKKSIDAIETRIK